MTNLELSKACETNELITGEMIDTLHELDDTGSVVTHNALTDMLYTLYDRLLEGDTIGFESIDVTTADDLKDYIYNNFSDSIIDLFNWRID